MLLTLCRPRRFPVRSTYSILVMQTVGGLQDTQLKVLLAISTIFSLPTSKEQFPLTRPSSWGRFSTEPHFLVRPFKTPSLSIPSGNPSRYLPGTTRLQDTTLGK